jgi:hypothetical protein
MEQALINSIRETGTYSAETEESGNVSRPLIERWEAETHLLEIRHEYIYPIDNPAWGAMLSSEPTVIEK